MSSLDRIWTELEAAGHAPAHKRVDAVHPLDLYVGIDADLSRELVLVADAVPQELAKRFKAFEVGVSDRSDGRHNLFVRLRAPELSRLYSHLCEDLADASRACRKQDAVRFVADRIARWENLLARDREGLLSEELLRGLVGELVFLRDVAIPEQGAAEALHAWRGPLGGLHDFQFATVSVEVKAVAERLIATITSAEQLDGGGDRLFLTAVRLHSTMDAVPTSFSVADLVQTLRQVFEPDIVQAQSFENRLALLGYKDEKEYEARRFTVKDMRHFEVEPTFPRLIPSMMAPGVVSVSYGVDLHRCEAFRRPSIF